MYVATDVSKAYGGIQALTEVDIDIRAGEVQALLGANGAGKSTLVKILVGAERPSQGKLELNGDGVQFRSVREANAHGISIVSQELNLFPDLDVLQNLFMLREPRYGGILLNRREMRRRAQTVVERVGLDVPLSTSAGELRLADQQLVEIARALLDAPKILFLDEPTSALQPADTQRLLQVVRRLRDSGVAIVYVSHFLEDVFAIADTITVIRNGRVVVQRQPRAEMTIEGTVPKMLGEAAVREHQYGVPHAVAAGANAQPLVLSGAAVTGRFNPLDLTAAPGEVLGLAGLEGSGAADVLDAIFGRRRLAAGSIVMPNGRRAPRSTAAAVRAGIAYAPADRKRLGVMLDKTVTENVTIVSAGPLRLLGVVLHKAVLAARTTAWRSRLGISASSETLVAQLSGGNQQKVVFAKWLDGEPKVVLLDDPTRGVDVGAKAEMHSIIAQMAERGQIVIMTSSDLEELANVCDRVLIFMQGTMVGEFHRAQLSEHRLLAAINTGAIVTEAA